MATITSAGAGSGIDLESIISASVEAKRAQLQTPVTTKKTNTQITLSGLGKLKSAISSYVSTLKDMTKTGAFNKRSVEVKQDEDNPVFSVETKTGASNGQYDITVNQLAATSKFTGTFSSSTSPLVTADATLTFGAGDKSFTVNVKAGDTLESIRKRINNNGDNFGVTANIINTASGEAKLVLDSGVTGSGKDMTITGTGELSSFSSNLTQTQTAQDAIITVDGNTLTSDTNEFDDSIVGLSLTVLRVSDTDTSDVTGATLKSNQLSITTDRTGIQDLVKGFINGYNSLVSTANGLGKRNTIVAGESQDDGGALAGDSVTRSVVNVMTGIVSSKSDQSSVYSYIFQLGVEMDKDGVLSLDEEKFNEALDNNFEQVVALFGGEEGVAGQLAGALEIYSRTGGLLAQRQDNLNSDLRELSRKQDTITAQMTKYEANLRAQYGSLDSLLVQMSQSLSYLNLISNSTSGT